ncbi:hypothetical protein MMC14_007917 [Varicellaria rhodocarpa]|nr:hypothetical protein [Varicellaria rhodocarpa]
MHIPSILLPFFLVPSLATLTLRYQKQQPQSQSQPQHLFSNPLPSHSTTYKIPSVHESAIQARRILHLSSIATLSTVFPSHDNPPSTYENRPPGMAGAPIGLMEYYATCPDSTSPSTPILLAISIASTYKNARAGSNVTLSLRYHPPSPHPPTSDPYLYSPANLPRFSLVGYVERIPDEEIARENISECFLERHEDARLWAPGNDIHESWWGRLVVQEVFFFGGFGDRARIGWLPVEEWQGVTMEEVEGYRLVGEEWSNHDGMKKGGGQRILE